VVAEEFCKFLPVVGVFMDAKFDILAELFIEFFEIFRFFSDFLEKL
jgi:hypothetical protein